MNYNWDDIELDDTLGHNSRYFFANCRRSRYERDQKDAEEQQEDELLKNCSNENRDQQQDLKRGIKIEKADCIEVLENENKENENKENDASQSSQGSSRYSLRSKLKVENITEDLLSNNTDTQCATCMAAKEQDDNETKETETEGNNDVDKISTQMDKIELPQNNENQLSSPKNVKNAKIITPSRWVVKDVPKVESQQPKAFQFHEIYQNKRKELLRKQQEEEKKMRIFHSRPMPNFQAQKLSNMPHVHYTTCPLTPKVLKRSIESQKKRLKKLQEVQQQENNVPSDHPISSVALQPRPYNLRCEKRVQERKKYDEAVQCNLEEKQKQEEERRKQEEEQQIKEIRKATAFKARPNPFRH